ncbi:helix-turn-helix domain-containing protein [Actinoplanes sp. TBRC 11911]|uniref:winged helix-turn-helix transcriptional regulator n=1 Tax=Actinoplanes sp. TBRC 11911 TaxID=2729386 RepID=UPI001B7D67BF|nr:helix-turn-helix domain-containing protein [Actinoplanes sp. TBRC 11911]
MTSRMDSSQFGDIDDESCRNFEAAVVLVGRRWTAAILLAIGRHAERFTDIRRHLNGITDPVLAQRLKELEGNNLISRTVIPTTPVQVRYELTERGRELLAGLAPLNLWYQKWHAADRAPVTPGTGGPS